MTSDQTLTIAEIAARFDLQARGDTDVVITSVATLANAKSGQLSFLSNPHYRSLLQTTQASVVVMREADAEQFSGAALIAKDPYVAFAKIAALFDPPAPISAGIHPSTVIDPTATISPQAEIGPFVSIGANASVAAGVRIGPGCVIGDDCHIDEASELVSRVTLVKRVRIGKRVLVHPGAVLGADGFGLAMDQGQWIKVPQQGGVRIGDDCEIGANTCIDRGAIEDTILEDDVRLDNLIQIGHNVRVGAHTAMAGCVAVAGSTTIGRYCLIGGAAGVVGHIEICDRVIITAMSLVTHSIKTPGEYSSGTPLMPNREWRKSAARFKQLDSMARRGRASDRTRDD